MLTLDVSSTKLLIDDLSPTHCPSILLFPEKIRELARHGETSGTSKARQMLEHAIEKSRGGVFPKLTPAAY